MIDKNDYGSFPAKKANISICPEEETSLRSCRPIVLLLTT
jgi:hypothetical protein